MMTDVIDFRKEIYSSSTEHCIDLVLGVLGHDVHHVQPLSFPRQQYCQVNFLRRRRL